jgi:D-alanyl-D-alanine carboxypeptidase (penicillin-binding protein 5/6)
MLISNGHSAFAEQLKTTAQQAFMLDAGTGTIFINKNADELMAPASMAKLLTVAVVFKALIAGEIELDKKIKISKHAWSTGGAPSRTSSMFAKLGSSVAVEDLLRSVIIQSGNDAAIALAEGVAGSEDDFVTRMNAYAEEIGMKSSSFYNASGLPHKMQAVTARDLAILALHLIETYPQFLGIFSEKEFTWNKIRQINKNPLVFNDERVDGLKTGYTDKSGYGIVVSALNDDRRVILVLNGLAKKKDRVAETKKLLDHAYSGVSFKRLYQKNEIIGTARVYGGEKANIRLKIKENISLFLPSRKAEEFKAQIKYEGPLLAPIGNDVKIGTFTIYHQDEVLKQVPVYTSEAIEEGSIVAIAKDAAIEWVLSKF